MTWAAAGLTGEEIHCWGESMLSQTVSLFPAYDQTTALDMARKRHFMVRFPIEPDTLLSLVPTPPSGS